MAAIIIKRFQNIKSECETLGSFMVQVPQNGIMRKACFFYGKKKSKQMLCSEMSVLEMIRDGSKSGHRSEVSVATSS